MGMFFFILFALIAVGFSAAVIKTLRAWADAQSRTSTQSTRVAAHDSSAKGYPYIA